MLNIGVFVDNLGIPVDKGLKIAAEIGCNSFQIYITGGEMLASNMNKEARADFVKKYQDAGLKLSATCGDFHLNFGDIEGMRQKEEILKDAILQTVDLGTNIMTTHIGTLGNDPEGKAKAAMVNNLKRLGDFAAEQGVKLATETGLESGPTLRSILEEADTPGLAVNFDPANLVMNGFDHLEAVRELIPFIVHTHAKDGTRVDEKANEVPLGEGGVNFPAYVGLLRELGYDGAYTIERERGDDPIEDVRKAVEFLKRL